MRDEEILLVREADESLAGQGVFSRQSSDAGERAVADASSGEGETHPVKTGLLLRVDSDVIGFLVARKIERACAARAG